MLKYSYIRMFALGSLLVLLVVKWMLGWNVIPLLLLVIIIYLLFIAWGSYFISSGFFLDAICKGKEEGNSIAISFDDGPNPAVTPVVLDMLKEHNVKASFFCIGKNIPGNELLLKRISDDGHLIGNHSWSHSYFFDFFRDSRVEAELNQTNDAIFKITGKKVNYFRPPFGVTNPVIARVVNKLEMPVIGWSIRSLDTTIKDPDQLFKRVVSRLKPGDIVLFHDSHPRIIPVLKKFLEHAKQHGFVVVELDKVI
jgi:peptidoglycan-N-acetylglucosamine deacetylase